MVDFQSALIYVFSFIAMYAQVFYLVLMFQQRKEIIHGTVLPEGDIDWPAVTLIVPCWNEENTVAKTVRSILKIDYPKNKLFVKVVDDGSTDGTWKAMQEFNGLENIELIHKENGGKHTAMNMAIEVAQTDYIACLDADAFVEENTLKKTMWEFHKDPELMAVSPSIVVHDPVGFFQKAADLEFNMFILMKKALSVLNGIHVTQGPFSIYRKKVFDDLGFYKNAHNTEDLEISYRMQANGYKIGQCHDAFVHTVTPKTFKTLYKQRLRWMYGFINNSFDYRGFLFKPKYGTFSVFTVPFGLIAIVGSLFMAGFLVVNLITGVFHLIQKLYITDFYITPITPHISPFFINTTPLTFISITLVVLVIVFALIGEKIRGRRPILGMSFIYLMIVYNFMTPLWLGRAVYNSLVTREMSWR